jgi:hypothetical protein
VRTRPGNAAATVILMVAGQRFQSPTRYGWLPLHGVKVNPDTTGSQVFLFPLFSLRNGRRPFTARVINGCFLRIVNTTTKKRRSDELTSVKPPLFGMIRGLIAYHDRWYPYAKITQSRFIRPIVLSVRQGLAMESRLAVNVFYLL